MSVSRKKLRAPFPWYGSKLGAASLIEQLMGPIKNLVIPFAGSLGELFGRSRPARVETVNDADGLVVNAWRAMKYSPELVAELVDEPVHEATMHAAHRLLIESAPYLPELLDTDPQAHHPGLAAWWIWGASCWLGSGWCSEISKKRPRLGGQGDRPHLGLGVARPLAVVRHVPHLSGGAGYPALGQGIHNGSNREALVERFRAIQERLRWVRVTCGDWKRVTTKSVTTSHGLTGVSLDPTYDHNLRSTRLYRVDDPGLSQSAREYARESGIDPLLRITLAGKWEEHDELLEHGWTRHEWRADGEVIWASPHCESQVAKLGPLFAEIGT